MVWIRYVEYNHNCWDTIPNSSEASAGSIWRCDGCGAMYEVYRNQFTLFNEWREYEEPLAND